MQVQSNYNIPLYPLTFEPVIKDYIWGGKELERFYGSLPYDKAAESWQASCHPNGVSTITNGPLKGKKLPQVIDVWGGSIVGTRFEGKKYPLLVKIIDAHEKLSVQVHPDDEYAFAHENEMGKNEMWYIISAKPGAYIYYGLNEGVTKEQFAEAIHAGTVEDLLYKLPVSAGDAVYIPAGTVHAICEGIMILEIQQSSDATYRVFDYNRKDADGNPARPLHIDKALGVINFSKAENKKQKGIKVQVGEKVFKTILAANKYFAAELWDVDGMVLSRSDRRKFFIYTVIHGSAEFENNGEVTTVPAGYSVLIPSSLGSYEIMGNFRAVKSYVPDLDEDIYEPLILQGFSREYISECIG